MRSLRIGFSWCVFLGTVSAIAAEPPTYHRDIVPVFRKYCLGCHNANDAEGGLNLETHAGALTGGENGEIVTRGKPNKSRVIALLEGREEPVMPPEGEPKPSAEELALLKRWIEGGAPEGNPADAPPLDVPKITPTGPARQPIAALAYSPDEKYLAVGRYGRVELIQAEDRSPLKSLSGPRGQVNAVEFSADGRFLFAAGGEPGRFGEAIMWLIPDGKVVHTFAGHRDSLLAAAVNPDGSVLATGSYDQSIILWDTKTGQSLRTLTGHNGAVFSVDFHPSGGLLASASGDRTVKLWDVESGGRIDTFTEPEKEQYAVSFRPDGRRLASTGVDNRVRIWRIRPNIKAGNSRLLFTRFAHEAPILALAWSPDGKLLATTGEDRLLKLWDANRMLLLQTLPEQSDWATVTAHPGGQSLLVGRMDGSLAAYPLPSSDQRPDIPQPLTSLTEPPTMNFADAPMVEVKETEPNDSSDDAVSLAIPGIATGVLQSEGDADLYRIESEKGQAWILETNAARNKSPADTKIEVLDSDGEPVLRYQLRAVRDSYITFRHIDSNQLDVRVKNWEEMELNQYLYMAGEVCKIFRMPQGPDSGFQFYKVNGKRLCYFDTSATVHAKEDPVYVVEPYLADAELTDNGLPVFPLYFANDDDGERKLGSDSRLIFEAPETGEYLIRVSDVRGFGGEKFAYSLTVRPPKPDFDVRVTSGKGATVGKESGQRLTFLVDRRDGFTGPVQIDITGVPVGFEIPSPVIVEAGHFEARSVIHRSPGFEPPPKEEWNQLSITATAVIHGKEVTKEIGNLGEIKYAEKPKIVVYLEPDSGSHAEEGRLVIAPGETITARLWIERNGYDGDIKFDVDNLPHGVIVDNIGLSGILIRAGETERQIFLTAADWVTESTRSIHAVSQVQGNQASAPIQITVRP